MEIGKLKVVELKKELGERGLAQHGLKKVLVARLQEALDAESKPETIGLEQDEPKDEPDSEPDKESAETARQQTAESRPEATRPGQDEPKEELEESLAQTVDSAKEDEQDCRGAKQDESEAKRVETARSVSVEVMEDGGEPSTSVHAEIIETAEGPVSPDEHASIDIMELTEGTEDVAAIGTAVSPSSEPGREASAFKGDTDMVAAAKSAEVTRHDGSIQIQEESGQAQEGVVPITEGMGSTQGNRDTETVIEDQQHNRKRYRPSASSMMDLPVNVVAPAVEIQREVAPSQHSPTNALYIRNFTRPLVVPHVKAALNAHAGEEAVYFWMDAVRSHAFVKFSSAAAATRVRQAVHGLPYPPEPDRKHLEVDYVLAEAIEEWVEMEEQRRGAKYEVQYENGVASLMEITKHAAAAGPIILSADELFKKTVHQPSIYYAEATHAA